MPCDDIQRMSWTVTQRTTPGNRESEIAFEALSNACEDLCARHFADDDGFSLTRYALSGALDGTRLVARRGRLQVILSVQRFERAHAVPIDGKRPIEIRLVASLGMLGTSDRARPKRREPASWGLIGCVAGTLGVSALALGSAAGVLSAGLQLALMLPVVVVWRTCMTLGIARRVRRQAAIGARETRVLQASLVDALPRWIRMRPGLEAERDRLSQALGLPPFRSPAHAPEDRASVADAPRRPRAAASISAA